MIPHAFQPDPHGRDVCDQKSDEDGRVEFCGQRRSEHMDETQGLRVQLAAALRERDEARALAEKWARIEGATVERGIRADADALSEIQGLQAALANANAEKVNLSALRTKQDSELVRLRTAMTEIINLASEKGWTLEECAAAIRAGDDPLTVLRYAVEREKSRAEKAEGDRNFWRQRYDAAAKLSGDIGSALSAEKARAEKEEAERRKTALFYNCGAEPPCEKCITCQWDDAREALAAARREIIQLRKDPQRALAAELLGEFEKAYADTESQMTDSDRVAARRFMDVVAALAAPAAGEERP